MLGIGDLVLLDQRICQVPSWSERPRCFPEHGMWRVRSTAQILSSPRLALRPRASIYRLLCIAPSLPQGLLLRLNEIMPRRLDT